MSSLMLQLGPHPKWSIILDKMNDDFMIIAKDLLKYMMTLQGIYNVQDIQELTDYLGMTYTESPDDHWTINFKKYITQILAR